MAVKPRAKLPQGCVLQRRGCYIEHAALYRASPHNPDHILFSCQVDWPRVKALIRYFNRHGGGFVANDGLFRNPPKRLELSAERLREEEVLFIGVRLFKEQSNPRLKRFVEQMMPLLVYNKVGAIKRQF